MCLKEEVRIWGLYIPSQQRMIKHVEKARHKKKDFGFLDGGRLWEGD